MSFIEQNKNKRKLTFYDFSKDIPESLGTLKKLEELTFDKASTIPQSIGELKNLRSLEINSDSFETLPETIGNLSNLQMLTLNCPKLKKLPEIKMVCSNLKYISITSSALENIPASYHLCENLKTIYLKIGKAKTLDGLEAFAQSKDLSISIEGNDLQQFPKGLLQLEFIKELTIKFPFKALPNSFGQITSLERLSIYMEHLTHLPESIEHLTKIWELNLYTPQLIELPACMANMKVRALNIKSTVLSEFPTVVPKIQSLTSLSIGGSQIQHIPDSLANLTQLTSIYFQKNTQLKTLPSSIGQLKNLKSLSIDNNHLTSLPDVFDQLHVLDSIQIEGNALTALPPSFAQLKTPVYLSFGNNPFGAMDLVLFEMPLDTVHYSTGYGPREDLKAYIDDSKKNGATSIHFPILGALFLSILEQKENQIQAHQLLNEYDFQALLSIYTIVSGKFRNFLIQTLVWRSTELLATSSLTEGTLAIAGTINLKKTKVKEALKGSLISYSSKMTEEVTIIILGNKIKNVEVIQRCKHPIFINEASLTELVEQFSKPYLVEAAKTEAGSFNQEIADLLLHRDANNVKIGLEMLDGGGVPEELLAILFAIHKLHPDKKIATKAKKFLLTKASDLLKERIKIRVSWRNNSKGSFLQHYDFWQIVKDTTLEKDIWQICLGAYLWQNDSMAISQNLHQMPKDLLPELIEAYGKDYLHYETMRISHKSKMLFLEQFYPYMNNCKELFLELEQLEQPIVAKGIAQLKNLTRLTLGYTYTEHDTPLDYNQAIELPNDIGAAPALKMLFIESTEGLRSFPRNIEQATQINTLRLSLDLSQFLSASPLKKLTKMDHFIFNFTNVNFSHLQVFLAQLPPSQKISFNYKHKDLKQHLNILQNSLVGYTLTQDSNYFSAERKS